MHLPVQNRLAPPPRDSVLPYILCKYFTFFVLELMQFVSILQHCTLDFGSYTKDLTIVNEDLSSVFILDNSPGAYQYNPGKAVGT